MKVLQLVYKIPWPLYDGGAYSLHFSMKAINTFATKHHVLAMAPSRQYGNPELLPEWMNEQLTFESVPVDNSIHFQGAFLNLLSTNDYFTIRFFHPEYLQRLAELLTNQDWDIIVLEHALFGHYLAEIRKIAPRTPVVLRTQNIEYQLWQSVAAKEKNPFKRLYLNFQSQRLKKFELDLFSKSDGLFVLSNQDKKQIEAFGIKTPSWIIPPCTDLFQTENYSSVNRPDAVVYHLGSMDWMPNQQGVKWFLQEVWPLIIQREPNALLALGGFKMPKELLLLNSDNVRVEDSPPDAMQWAEDKGILIVPVISGGGVRIKIMEAMALGKAIVSTSHGAYGLGLEHQKHLLIADTPLAFAQAVVFLIQQQKERQMLARNAFEFAKEHFHYRKTGEKIFRALRDIKHKN